MTATMSFTCNICGEESSRICARCTKDTCNNHICEKCLRCSDCCECELMLDETARPAVRPAVPVLPAPEHEIEPEIAEEEPVLEASTDEESVMDQPSAETGETGETGDSILNT